MNQVFLFFTYRTTYIFHKAVAYFFRPRMHIKKGDDFLKRKFLFVWVLALCLMITEQRTLANDAQTFIQVEAGSYHSIGLLKDGTVVTWGRNRDGQLGYETQEVNGGPDRVPSLDSVVKVSAGSDHSLALKADGTVWAWGDNDYGQLGDDFKSDNRTKPEKVLNLSDVLEVSAGDHFNIALKKDGTVWTWGENYYHQLGDASRPIVDAMVGTVKGLNRIVEISAGATHGLALDKDGRVWAWGDAYRANRETDLVLTGVEHSAKNRTEPVLIEGLFDVVSISAGMDHDMALKADGSVWTWGLNYYGQLGEGTLEHRIEPVKVEGLDDVKEIKAGKYVSFVLTESGEIWGWGATDTGILSDYADYNLLEPVKIAELKDAKDIALGDEHILILTEDSDIKGWGNNDRNQIDDSKTEEIKTPKILDPLGGTNEGEPTQEAPMGGTNEGKPTQEAPYGSGDEGESIQEPPTGLGNEGQPTQEPPMGEMDEGEPDRKPPVGEVDEGESDRKPPVGEGYEGESTQEPPMAETDEGEPDRKAPVGEGDEADSSFESRFQDIGAHIWAKQQITELERLQIINGVNPQTYAPANSIKRGDFLLLLVKVLDLKATFTQNFEDVAENSYYYEALGIARALGIAKGVGQNRYAPNEPIKRQDVAVLMADALRVLGGLDDLEDGSHPLDRFEDKGKISDYAKESMAILLKKQIFVGDQALLHPLDPLTRAETAVLMHRLYKNYR
jgi:alpha-tubulin suppressor-like RCC1 family protein